MIMKKINQKMLTALLLLYIPLQINVVAQNRYSKIDKLFNEIETQDLGLGSISIFKSGEEIYQAQAGFQNIENQVKTSSKTKYRIGSISKMFTAVMIMQLVEENKLDLDTKLNKFFPRIPNADKITIEHLLRHESGLKEIVKQPGMDKWLQNAHSKKEMIQKFKKFGVDFFPGEKQEYNNNGYVLLSYILDKIEQKSFSEVLKTRIVTPLNLKNTYYGKNMGDQKEEALSYVKKNQWEESSYLHYSLPLGAGGIVSTPHDLNIFINAIFSEKLVSGKTLKLMFPKANSFGLGLMNYKLDDSQALGHTGGIDEYRSWILYFPSRNISIAYSSNGQDKPFKEIVKEIFKAFKSAKEKEVELRDAIHEQDSLIFDAVFIKHDKDYLLSKLSSDLEFYHDKGGLTDTSAVTFVKNFERIWKRQENGDKKWMKRKLIKETLEVHPIANYGVLQLADHQFYEIEDDGSETLVDNAKIAQIWKKTDGIWKLSRVVSYEHKNVTDWKKEIEQKVLNEMKEHHIPSTSVSVIENGVVTYMKTFGELKKGIPATNEAIYKVASITKPVVATLVLKLVDQGQWNLDEPLVKYFVDEDVKNSKWLNKLSTRHVLNHRSGFPNWRFQTESGKLSFLFEPGTKFGYSGEGFEYLRKALEFKFNKSLEEIAKEKLFSEIGMDETWFWWEKDLDESRYAVNHDKEGKPYEIEKYYEAMAAGNLLTTITDYTNFVKYLLTDKAISNNLWRQIITVNGKKDKGLPFGLGWIVIDELSNGEYALAHNGNDPGVKTFVLVLPESKRAIVVLMNGQDGQYVYREIIKTVLDIGGEIVDIISKF